MKAEHRTPPMQGYNIHLGRDVYVNFGAVFLDCNTIHIGMAMQQLRVTCAQDLITHALRYTLPVMVQAIGACWRPTCSCTQRGIPWTQSSGMALWDQSLHDPSGSATTAGW